MVMSLAEQIKQKAIELGFDLVGITDASPIDSHQVEILTNWLKSNFAGQMDYMYRNLKKRINPAELLEGARSVIVVGINYTPPKNSNQSRILQNDVRQSGSVDITLNESRLNETTSNIISENVHGFYNSTNPQTETDPQWTGNQSFYYNITNPYGFYNSTNKQPVSNYTEDEIEAFIFDNDNTANLNMSTYNITIGSCEQYWNGTCLFVECPTTTSIQC